MDVRIRPAWILPHSSPTWSPAAAARSASEFARSSPSPPLPPQYSASTRSTSRARSSSAGGTSASARGGQATPRRGGQQPVDRRPELAAVATGLLEVVAEDLVQLDQLGPPVLLQPGGEALVELGADRLRQRAVSGSRPRQRAVRGTV